jgi:hypothetical protein
MKPVSNRDKDLERKTIPHADIRDDRNTFRNRKPLDVPDYPARCVKNLGKQ